MNEQLFHKPLVNGEKGCYASHLRAWQWLLDSQHSALVVLEDDVKLKPEFAAVVEAIAALPAAWDMVKLLGRPATGKREKLRGQRALIPGTDLVDYARIPSLTAGYVISRAGAGKLLKSRLPFGRPIDVDLRHFWENGMQIQGVEPAAIELDETSFESSIGDKPKGGLAARWRKVPSQDGIHGSQSLAHKMTLHLSDFERAVRRAAPKPARIPPGDRSAYSPGEGLH